MRPMTVWPQSIALFAGCLLLTVPAFGEPRTDHSALATTLYSGTAVVANVLPIVPAVFEPRCLPGYVVCKLMFAGSKKM